MLFSVVGCYKIEVKLMVETAWLIYFFGMDLSLWHMFITILCHEFHWWLVWECEQHLFWDFFVKFVGFLEYFAKEREI